MLTALLPLLASDITEVSPNLHQTHNITVLERPPDYGMTPSSYFDTAEPDMCQIDSKLGNLTYSQARELETILEDLGPIDSTTLPRMVDLIKRYKKIAEASTWIYTYLKGFFPAKNCSDLMASFEDFLGRHMTSLRHRMPSAFSTAFMRFVDGHIKKKMATRSSSINAVLEPCKTSMYDLDFVIGATNKYVSWDQFYILAAEYLGRRLSIIARVKRRLKRLMQSYRRS